MSAFFKRKDIQITIVGVSFLIVFLPYFFDVPALQTFSVKLTTVASLVNAFTLALAIHAQFRRAINAWRVKSKGWGWGIYMLIALILMILFGIYGQDKEPWHFILFAVINPLSSVNYSILAFYMSSAAARAFRARNLNATLLLLSGFIVLLYQAPMTGAVFPAISPVALYITGTFAMAYARVITMGTTVASIVLGVRMLTGREVSFLGFARESD
jgi:hypothetical protein